jgi:hypothetical protein
MQGDGISITAQLYTAHVLAVLCEVWQEAVVQVSSADLFRDAAELQHSCLVQSAVGPGSAAQACCIVCQALQHCQQAGVWQLQQ